MSKIFSRILFLVSISLFVVNGANASSETETNQEQEPTRQFRFYGSMQSRFSENFEGVPTTGFGFFSVYDFLLKNNFTIGISFAYRFYTGEGTLLQTNYGLLLKHYLVSGDFKTKPFRPYLQYGLLLLNSFVLAENGYGTSHDTRLTVGSDLVLFELPLSVEISYHMSNLHYFQLAAVPMSFIECNLGYRILW